MWYCNFYSLRDVCCRYQKHKKKKKHSHCSGIHCDGNNTTNHFHYCHYCDYHCAHSTALPSLLSSFILINHKKTAFHQSNKNTTEPENQAPVCQAPVSLEKNENFIPAQLQYVVATTYCNLLLYVIQLHCGLQYSRSKQIRPNNLHG